MQEAEKLIVYYAINLYLLHENDNALHLILDYALKAQGSKLYEANLYRILGLIYLHKVEVHKAIDAFKTADELYNKSKSVYG